MSSFTENVSMPTVDGDAVYATHPRASAPGSPEEHFAAYKKKYDHSLSNPPEFWKEQALKYVSWFHQFDEDGDAIMGGSIDHGDVHWFRNGKLNVAYNCVDRHVSNGNGEETALIWEGDEPGLNRSITYIEMQREVSKIANVMKAQGVRKGDVVTIYMPMIPELAMVMLACCRIGAIHSIVFAGFSADSLRGRIVDCDSKWVFTSDEGKRGGRQLKLKDIVNAALEAPADADRAEGGGGADVRTVFTYRRDATFSASGAVPDDYEEKSPMTAGRDVYMDELLLKAQSYCPCEWMDAEDTMFILYTSGSTGKPKGVAHTTGGYLVNAAMTTSTTFDIQKKDIYCCVADCGWITGHTYIVYGPLCLGCTSVMFESVPTYPDPYRYWDVVQRHKVTQFYTAPTAVRALMRYPTGPIKNYDLSSLRILGSVGEPINPEAWKWYNEHVGRNQCTIVDTYWQTETGAHIATNLPGVMPQKPGSCALPYYGIEFAVVDSATGKELLGNNVEGVLCIKRSWPSMARTVYGDHDRYLNVYLRPYPGFYFTGDGCKRDNNGYYTITGRVDDVINPSGHRIGTAEVESSLVACTEVSEAAVVGYPHEVKGEGICCFVILGAAYEGSDDLAKRLKNAVRTSIGPFATPDMIIFSDLPKTRSGKIMRRILRKIAAGEADSIGDTSTLADPTIVDKLISEFNVVASASACSGKK